MRDGCPRCGEPPGQYVTISRFPHRKPEHANHQGHCRRCGHSWAWREEATEQEDLSALEAQIRGIVGGWLARDATEAVTKAIMVAVRAARAAR